MREQGRAALGAKAASRETTAAGTNRVRLRRAGDRCVRHPAAQRMEGTFPSRQYIKVMHVCQDIKVSSTKSSCAGAGYNRAWYASTTAL